MGPSPARDDGGVPPCHIDLPSQSDCLSRNQNLPGKQRHVLCAGHRSGHHVVARHRVSPRHLHRRRGAAGIPAAFSGLGLGRARAGGHLDHDGRGLPRGAGEGGPDGQGHRRDRHHQPARDHRRVGPRHRAGRPPRHRLAGPPHRRHLRQAEERRPRADDLGQDRPDHRPLFLRHESRLDPRPRAGRARTRRARRTDVRHRRLLSAVAADRRQGARHRRHQRLAHAAVQHPHRRMGRRTAEAPARAALDAAGGEGLLRQIRRQRPRACSAARSRSPASPATSRPPPSARPASRPA